MKSATSRYWLVVPAALLAVAVQAHDPAEHMQESNNPDCAAMKGMDKTKMSKDDPVMQALRQKCMDSMKSEMHGTMDDGAMHDGAMHDGAMHDGAMHDGAMHDGAMHGGSMEGTHRQMHGDGDGAMHGDMHGNRYEKRE